MAPEVKSEESARAMPCNGDALPNEMRSGVGVVGSVRTSPKLEKDAPRWAWFRSNMAKPRRKKSNTGVVRSKRLQL